MLEMIKELWPLVVYGAAVVIWLARLDWRTREVGKSRNICERRCEDRIDVLKADYNDDLKELKEDLKENIKLSQSMNLSLTSLTSFLHGKGMITPGKE